MNLKSQLQKEKHQEMNRAEVRKVELRARPDKRKYMENLAPLEEEEATRNE